MRTALPGEPNYAAVDRYTPLHVLWGVLLGASGMSWPIALGLSVSWEVVQRRLTRKLSKTFPSMTLDTLTNSTGDVGANMLGYLMGREIRRI